MNRGGYLKTHRVFLSFSYLLPITHSRANLRVLKAQSETQGSSATLAVHCPDPWSSQAVAPEELTPRSRPLATLNRVLANRLTRTDPRFRHR